MMLFQIAVFSLVITLIMTFLVRKLPLYITIPTTTALCYGLAVYGTTLFGYAISQQYVDGQTARVVYAISNYVLVVFEDDSQPRLIRMDSERDAMEAKKSEQNEEVEITFGKESGADDNDGMSGGGKGQHESLDNSSIKRKKMLKPTG